MKKVRNSILLVFLSSSMMLVKAQKEKDEKSKEIQEVVVTALGIKRDKKSLGYSTQSVKAEEISAVPSSNFTSNLSGKVAGLQVKAGTNFGGSVDVVLRGYKSITGNNQPLYVVDGIPLINANNNTAKQKESSAYGYDFGNTISDINPNDIAEVNVLKGAAATALYGSRAGNGAIIITTKKGRTGKAIGIEFNSSISISQINKETFPTYQSQYGAGYGLVYGPNKNSGFNLYNGDPAVPSGEDASYGAAFDPNLMVYHYGAFIPGSDTFGKKSPWVAAKNGPVTFFKTGTMYNNGVSFSKGNDVANFRMSFNNQNGTDVLPNSSMNKNTFSGNASYKILDNLNATIGATYVSQQVTGRNSTGYTKNNIALFRQWWQTNVDLKEQENLYFSTGKNLTWNAKSPTDLSPAYWNNPYFDRYQNFSYDTRDRVAANMSLSYDINDKLNLLARVGTDGLTQRMEDRRAVGSIPVAMEFGVSPALQPSGFAVQNIKQRETNYDLIANYKNDFSEKVTFNALIGSNINVIDRYLNAEATSGGLLIPGIYTTANTTSAAPNPITINTSKNIFGVFGQANIGYDGTYYLEGTLRRDVSSALPSNNNTYWYYSLSSSIVLSNFSFLKGSILNYGKLRASYAEVGNDTNPNLIIDQYFPANAFGSNPLYYFNTSKKTSDLRPERSKQTEIGLNLQFFKNRIGIDAAWFRNDSFDQILALPVSYATGFSTQFQNVGNLRTDGFELALNTVPVKTNNFRWELGFNWSNPLTRVTALSNGVQNITLGSYQGGVSINASIDDLYGTIKGTTYLLTNGERTLDASGNYVKTDTNQVIGNMQAKWFGGITNRLIYKNFAASFQVDIREGGHIFSVDQYYGLSTGLYPESFGTNDLGNPYKNSIANGGGIILPGVTTTGTPNTKRLDVSTFSPFGYKVQPASAFVYDASFVKLREVSLSYSLPSSALENTFVKGITFSAIGSNLWIIKKYIPYADPEATLSSGNTQGYQSGVMPSNKVYSFSVKINF